MASITFFVIIFVVFFFRLKLSLKYRSRWGSVSFSICKHGLDKNVFSFFDVTADLTALPPHCNINVASRAKSGSFRSFVAICRGKLLGRGENLINFAVEI